VETFQKFKCKTFKYDYQYYLMAIEKVVFESIHERLFRLYVDMNFKLEERYNMQKYA